MKLIFFSYIFLRYLLEIGREIVKSVDLSNQNSNFFQIYVVVEQLDNTIYIYDIYACFSSNGALQ